MFVSTSEFLVSNVLSNPLLHTDGMTRFRNAVESNVFSRLGLLLIVLNAVVISLQADEHMKRSLIQFQSAYWFHGAFSISPTHTTTNKQISWEDRTNRTDTV